MRHAGFASSDLVGLDVNPQSGLMASQARERLLRYGENLLTGEARRSTWRDLLRPFSDPMVVLLLVAGVVYFFLGDLLDAAVMLAAVIPIAGIDLLLEIRAERALEQLRRLSAPKADVKRDGIWTTINASKVVPGDIARIYEGMVIPADGILLSGTDLQIDESAITGESLPVIKEGTGWPPRQDIQEEQEKLLAGTTVLSGRGEMAVIHTGKNTVQGEIGTLLAESQTTRTPTERAIAQLVKVIGVAAGFLVVAVVILLLARGAGLGEALIGGISLGIAAIPEEFAIVFALFLALGAQHMASRNALIRRLAAVETLGSINVIATDKTGTLTLGQLSVGALGIDNHIIAATEANSNANAMTLVDSAVFASEPNPFDPLEKAIVGFAAKLGKTQNDIFDNKRLVYEYRFESQRRYMSHIWQDPEGRMRLYAKGAIEAILDRCPMDEKRQQHLLATNDQMAGQGMRVVAVGQRDLATISGDRERDEYGLEFLGLIGLTDPPRPEAKAAVEESQRAGIRVLMVTGDHPKTAHAIAEAVGLAHEDEHVATGTDLEKASPEQLRQLFLSTNIFARVLPAQKYRLVTALKQMGRVVAVTGDGVNDAPALRAADIGVAMGRRGTDVARSAAGMVLLDDNFFTIVEAVREGRRIFSNLQKAFSYLVAYHIPIALAAFIAPLVGLPLILLPIHLVWLELVVHPTSSLVFLSDPADPDAMRRPPRDPLKPFLTLQQLRTTVIAGLGLLAIILAIFIYNLSQGQTVEVARALTLGAFIIGNAALAEIERAKTTTPQTGRLLQNRLANAILLSAVGSFVVIVYWPPLATIFQVQPPDTILWLQPLVLVGIWTAMILVFRAAQSEEEKQ